MESYVSIGYTRKPVGIKGELRIHVKEEYLEDCLQATVLFVAMDGAPVPYFVENFRIGKTPVVKFEEVHDPESAQLLGSKELFLRQSDLLPEEERTLEVEGLQYEYVIGYTLYDEERKVGVIEEVQEFPQQEMAIVKYREQELYIPLNEHLIRSIDKEAKKIIVALPEGLLDL